MSDMTSTSADGGQMPDGTKRRAVRKPLSAATVARLFSRFGAIWPRAWADVTCAASDPSVMAAEWAFALSGATPDDLSRGVAACRDRMPWPPSIAEFRAACGLADAPARTGAHRMYLPPPPRAPGAAESARGHLRLVRSILADVTPAPEEGAA